MKGQSNLLKRVPAFAAWLRSRGAEVLVTTSQWEVARFRVNGHVHVVYRNQRNDLTMTPDLEIIVKAFLKGTKWTAGVATKRVNTLSVEKRSLLERDGDRCFLCGFPLEDDITVEHLVSVAHGGPNHIANKALAHAFCNGRMGHLSLMEKIALRDQIRNT